ncbi:MAG: hypothetical protein IPP32_03140 [Bacteroidetes bacterium]|nr:hypothetical protein [Bacteroidota bacterium]
MAEDELPIMSEEQVNIFKAIDIFIKRFRIFIVSELEKVYPDNWATEFRNALQCPPPNHKQKNWDKSVRQNDNIVSVDFIDFQYLELFASNKKEFLKPIFKDDRFHLPTWFNEIANVRNLTSHFTFDKLTNDEKDLAWIRMKSIAEYMNDAELLSAITSLRDNRPISKKNNETLVPKQLISSRKKILRSFLIFALVGSFFTLFYYLFYYPREKEQMLERHDCHFE